MRQHVKLGKWTESEIDLLLKDASDIADPGERVGYISAFFLDTPYRGSTLAGGENGGEVFVINLDEVDCLTLIEYVEAMRRSGSFQEFAVNLKKVRYMEGNISYRSRKHFFTEWALYDSEYIIDVTALIGSGRVKTVKKRLNEKEDGRPFVPGVESRDVELGYIPTAYYDSFVAGKINTGDYGGIYSEKQGLDVSHAGIFIKKGGNVLFRHASSSGQFRKVVDEVVETYIKDKPGLIILRPVDRAT